MAHVKLLCVFIILSLQSPDHHGPTPGSWNILYRPPRGAACPSNLLELLGDDQNAVQPSIYQSSRLCRLTISEDAVELSKVFNKLRLRWHSGYANSLLIAMKLTSDPESGRPPKCSHSDERSSPINLACKNSDVRPTPGQGGCRGRRLCTATYPAPYFDLQHVPKGWHPQPFIRFYERVTPPVFAV